MAVKLMMGSAPKLQLKKLWCKSKLQLFRAQDSHNYGNNAFYATKVA